MFKYRCCSNTIIVLISLVLVYVVYVVTLATVSLASHLSWKRNDPSLTTVCLTAAGVTGGVEIVR